MKKTCLFLLLFFFSAQSKAAYTHWVFEGAGIRGIAYVGALKALDKTKQLDAIEAVGGSSAGAITACFLALGYTPLEMEKHVLAMNFQDFNDNKFPLISGMRNIKKHYGWYEGRVFEKWIRGHIAARTGNAHITFGQLHDNKAYKDLSIMGTSVNNQRSIVFNYKTYPAMEIATAVRISMSIPYYFKTVCIDSVGRHLKKIPRTGYYDLCVDGGISSNLPVELFAVPQEQILAFQIVRKDQMENKNAKEIAPYKVNNFSFFMKALYNLVMESRQSMKLKNYGDVRMVKISDGGIGPKIRKLKKKDVQLLLNNGLLAIDKSFAASVAH